MAAFVPLLFLGAACGGPSAAQPARAPEPLRVRAEEIERRAIAEPVRASGVVLDESTRTLAFAVAGVIADVRVDEGDVVRRGQVLARLELDAVAADASRAQAALTRAERDLARAEALSRSGALPGQTLDDARTLVDVSAADARAAAFARRHAVIVAPGDGVVLARTADPGETVSAGAPVLALALEDEGRVARVLVTDREIVRLRVGDPATIVLDARPDAPMTGTIARLAAGADPASGLHAVELVAEGLGARGRAGLVVRATITPSDARTVALVPANALLEADGATGFVWALRDDRRRATRRAVRIAFLHEGRVAIADDLEGAREVVTDGAAYVRARSMLEIVADDARSAP